MTVTHRSQAGLEALEKKPEAGRAGGVEESRREEVQLDRVDESDVVDEEVIGQHDLEMPLGEEGVGMVMGMEREKLWEDGDEQSKDKKKNKKVQSTQGLKNTLSDVFKTRSGRNIIFK